MGWDGSDQDEGWVININVFFTLDCSNLIQRKSSHNLTH